MKKINSISILCIGVLFVWGWTSTAQTKVSETDVLAYLEGTKQLSCKNVVTDDFAKVSSARLYKGFIAFKLDNNSWQDEPEGTFFMKVGGELQPFSSFVEAAISQDFINTIRKEFILDNTVAAETFQSLLSVFDGKDYFKGFFQSGDTWYFIRSEFFDDIEHFKVETDGKGRITAISYGQSLDVDRPDDLSGAGGKAAVQTGESNPIDPADSGQMIDYLNAQLKYRFEVVEKTQELIQQVSDAQLFDGSLILTEDEQGMTYEVTRPVIVVAYAGRMAHMSSERALLEDALFVQSLKKHSMKSSVDAQILADALAIIQPLEMGEQTAVEPQEKEGVWILTWEKNDEESAGFMVKVDEKGQIEYIDYNSFNATNMLKLRMKDPNFKVSYDFALTTPADTKVDLKKGSSLPVTIQFNALAANARGAWILTRFNGKKVGMRAGTSIESPFNDEVPDKVLTEGQHTLEYLLLPNGQSTENPLGLVKIEINVN